MCQGSARLAHLFIYSHCTTCVQEVLTNPLVSGRVANTMAAKEVSGLKDFMKMMAQDSARAFYGPGHVLAANEMGRWPGLCVKVPLDCIQSAAIKFRLACLFKNKFYCLPV